PVFPFPGGLSSSPLVSGSLAQGDFFLPFGRQRAVIGGAVSVSNSRLQSLTEARVIGPPNPIFPEGIPGVRYAASSTETSSVTGLLMPANRFAAERLPTFGAA